MVGMMVDGDVFSVAVVTLEADACSWIDMTTSLFASEFGDRGPMRQVFVARVLENSAAPQICLTGPRRFLEKSEILLTSPNSFPLQYDSPTASCAPSRW